MKMTVITNCTTRLAAAIAKTPNFVIVLATLLAGCAPGPHLFVTNGFFNAGTTVGDDMIGHNLVATVGFDEVHYDDLSLRAERVAYMQSIEKGSPVARYRYVYLNTGALTGLLWYADGQYNWATAAIVPDSIRRLRAGDVVEFRLTGMYKTLLNFDATNEGNIVVRVLCRKADPDWNACVDKLPRTGKYRATGQTKTPFPASVKEYGYTFTPAYADGGKPLRPIPEYSPAHR